MNGAEYNTLTPAFAFSLVAFRFAKVRKSRWLRLLFQLLQFLLEHHLLLLLFSCSFVSLGKRNASCARMLQGDVPAGCTALPELRLRSDPHDSRTVK